MFYPPEIVQRAKSNIEKDNWARQEYERVISAANPWMRMDDESLWKLMFGNTIRRSWMVWSDGHCPACKKSVPMYNWKIDAFRHPWKVQCPHCGEFFPKNDFQKFYESGLDEHGIFDPKKANRALLFNENHPDPNDPLHMFGVDDGEGYTEGANRWRFIGTYLVYGQWKQMILAGITNLAAAYVLTGEISYAHKAGILLDRVADLYPTFDFWNQGVLYEERHRGAGYVSTWHDACEETRLLALAYDQVFDGLKNDPDLPTFLSQKSKEYGLENPKASFADIQRNIEDRILRDALSHPEKIHSNYPRQPITIATMKMILDWPENREEVYRILDEMLTKSTAVDGVTGEKGLAGYSSYTISGLATFLEMCARLNPDFLPDMMHRHPQLRETYRFHIDTWCMQEYYPAIGDTLVFASKCPYYVGVAFSKTPGVGPSMFSFLGRLYNLTGDPAYLQVVHHANGSSYDNLPYDIFAENPDSYRKMVEELITREGPKLHVQSVNKEGWCLAILRSGCGNHARAVWLDYDSGGSHGHMDGMNLGFYAHGLDLMPDFGYKPVQYGGWNSPKANWYGATAAHNTVVVDGLDQRVTTGKTTFWSDGKTFRAIRASAPELIAGSQYERTVALIDISDTEFYVADIFRVVGGENHAKFVRSHFGTISVDGLKLEIAEGYDHGTQMRNFKCDSAPQPRWTVDWTIEDRWQYLPPNMELHFRYTDFTSDAEACTAESWISPSMFKDVDEIWIPTIMVRRTGKSPLASNFVSLMWPYQKKSNIVNTKRLPLETRSRKLYPDSNVTLELTLADGRQDLFIAMDAENPLALTPSKTARSAICQPDWDLSCDAEICWVRKSASGVERVALGRGSFIRIGNLLIKLKTHTEFIELVLEGRRFQIVTGDPQCVEKVYLENRKLEMASDSALTCNSTK